MPDIAIWIILVVVAVVALITLVVLGSFLSLWIQALSARAKVSFFDLIGMKLRKVDPRIIVLSRIQATKAGIDASTAQLETHYLAGGRVRSVVNALIAASRAKMELTWDSACAIDLAGRDILEAVQTSVNPKVIDCPEPSSGRRTIDAVAQDGIQLRAKARVTVRANLARLVGGATEETITHRARGRTAPAP